MDFPWLLRAPLRLRSNVWTMEMEPVPSATSPPPQESTTSPSNSQIATSQGHHSLPRSVVSFYHHSNTVIVLGITVHGDLGEGGYDTMIFYLHVHTHTHTCTQPPHEGEPCFVFEGIEFFISIFHTLVLNQVGRGNFHQIFYHKLKTHRLYNI